jgi:NAD(P)-dependent dehydrogenase (short-subunit alcohol dehydrogenase family)
LNSKEERNKIMNRVKGKTIIVTGGAVGIGRAISLILAQEGAKVAVTDLQDEAGRKVVEEITKAGGSAAFWHMDVSNESEVKRMFAQIVGKFGGIDVLVNNAGISGTNKPTHEITCEEWDQVMAVNVKGVFLYAKEKIRVNSRSIRASSGRRWSRNWASGLTRVSRNSVRISTACIRSVMSVCQRT